MAETKVPHWMIGVALSLFGTAVAAEPMGEATNNVGTWELASALSSNMFQ